MIKFLKQFKWEIIFTIIFLMIITAGSDESENISAENENTTIETSNGKKYTFNDKNIKVISKEMILNEIKTTEQAQNYILQELKNKYRYILYPEDTILVYYSSYESTKANKGNYYLIHFDDTFFNLPDTQQQYITEYIDELCTKVDKKIKKSKYDEPTIMVYISTKKYEYGEYKLGTHWIMERENINYDKLTVTNYMTIKALNVKEYNELKNNY